MPPAVKVPGVPVMNSGITQPGNTPVTPSLGKVMSVIGPTPLMKNCVFRRSVSRAETMLASAMKAA